MGDPRNPRCPGLTPENFADGYLIVKRLKGSERTVHPLVDDGHELLNEPSAVAGWLARHKALHQGDGDGRRLFPISRAHADRLIKRYGRAAGLPARLCHMHVLKHSIAMQSIKGGGIENVKKWLGHKSIASTGEYLKVSDEEAARAVIGAASQRSVQRGLFGGR